jgi:hypothetical protein
MNRLFLPLKRLLYGQYIYSKTYTNTFSCLFVPLLPKSNPKIPTSLLHMEFFVAVFLNESQLSECPCSSFVQTHQVSAEVSPTKATLTRTMVFASSPPQKCVGLFVIYGVLASSVLKPKPKCFMTPLFSSQIQRNNLCGVLHGNVANLKIVNMYVSTGIYSKNDGKSSLCCLFLRSSFEIKIHTTGTYVELFVELLQKPTTSLESHCSSFPRRSVERESKPASQNAISK